MLFINKSNIIVNGFTLIISKYYIPTIFFQSLLEKYMGKRSDTNNRHYIFYYMSKQVLKYIYFYFLWYALTKPFITKSYHFAINFNSWNHDIINL